MHVIFIKDDAYKTVKSVRVIQTFDQVICLFFCQQFLNLIRSTCVKAGYINRERSMRAERFQEHRYDAILSEINLQ